MVNLDVMNFLMLRLSVNLSSVFHTFLPQILSLSLLRVRQGQEIESRSGSGLASQP